MKNLIILVVLFVSVTAFSQSNVDSVRTNLSSSKSIVIQKVDSIQIARIDRIEKRLSLYYTYNRRSQALLYMSIGLTAAGLILASGRKTSAASVVMPLAGSFVGIIGTIISIDSFKFLNFKPKSLERVAIY